MRAALIVLPPLLLAGCQSLFGIDDPDKLVDAKPGVGAEMGETCYGTDVTICIQPPPDMLLVVGGTVDTGIDTNCDRVVDGRCFLIGSDVRIDDLRAYGTRPLVIIGTKSITVAGTLDVASHRGEHTGAGVPGPACMAFGKTPSFKTTGGGFNGGFAGGGAGGTFTASGGNGGSNTGAQAGQVGTVIPAAFRAGCDGQTGGARTGNTTGAGGAGGGAVYLIAGETLAVTTGVIDASGAAGEPGRCAMCIASGGELRDGDAYGGGGGGSGGAIELEAPTISLDAGLKAYADGGGGAQGSSRSVNGVPGLEATALAAATGGISGNSGGPGPQHGGDGGSGSRPTPTGLAGLLSKDGTGEANPPGGGGGGGGGAGYVKLIGTVTGSGTTSP